MIETLSTHHFRDFETSSGHLLKNVDLTYEIFGCALHTAPIVLIHHALTGNSDVISSEKGWWKSVVGDQKLIDTTRYTVIAFNIPGNGYQGNIINQYKALSMNDVADMIYIALKAMGVNKVYASLGGSIGGALAWHLAVRTQDFIEYIIPIAADWKATAWVLGYCTSQSAILNHSDSPLYAARIMAMLLYRTPASLSHKFGRSKNDQGQFNIDSWLNHHGEKLSNRFDFRAYQLMNHLMTTIGIAKEDDFHNAAKKITSKIIQIGIDSDYLFLHEENQKTAEILDELNIDNELHTIHSIHGHDGFLIESEQINKILQSIF